MPERKNNREPHSWVEERLSAYMDNQLPPLERVKVERHLRECSQCERALSSLQWTVSLLKQAPAPALPRSFVLPVPKPAPRAPIISISLLRLATAMATLLLISLVGVDLILQSGGTAAPASLYGQRVAIAPTVVAAQPQAVQEPPTQAADVQTLKQGFAAATAAPTTAPAAKATAAPTAVPPAVAPLPAALATATPLPPAPKPTSAPAATSAPPATSAPAAGALQSQTGAPSGPSLRSSAVQGSPTPSAPLVTGRGGGNEKSGQDSAAVTAAPLQPQPKSLEAEPKDTASPPATETPPSVLPTPTVVSPPATATPRQEALVQPTRAPTTPPAVAPPSEEAFPVSPLRIAELGVLFVAVFLGVLTLFLRR